MIELLQFDVEQGTEDWFRCRMGIPTASSFATVMAKGRTKGSPSLTRLKYMRRLAAERYLGEPHETYTNAHMERGHVMEVEAAEQYAFTHEVEIERVGFIRRKGIEVGCSPDGLIGPEGIVEFKSALPEIIIEKIDKGDFPSEHKAQCQGALWVTGRAWCDLVVYWPGLWFEKRIHRDEEYITRIEEEVTQFNDELRSMVERVRAYHEGGSAIKKQLDQSVVACSV